jgi:hypothetical protein
MFDDCIYCCCMGVILGTAATLLALRIYNLK